MKALDEKTKLLRLIAEFGFSWKIGDPNPNIPVRDYGYHQVDQGVLQSLVKDKYLEPIIGDESGLTTIHYIITDLGIGEFIRGFPYLKIQTGEATKTTVAFAFSGEDRA